MTPASQPGYAFADGVVPRCVDGEMVLLHVERQEYFGLDSIGADVVTRLVSSAAQKAHEELSRRYDVDEGVLARDVETLVTALLEAGLLWPLSRDG